MPYQIEIADEALEHLKALEAGERSSLLTAIAKSLLHEPAVPARNRKPM